jgi:PAS domain S-box-containing protein
MRIPREAGQFADSGILHLLMDSLPALVSYVTRDLHYGWINRYYEDWFGRPRQDLIGRHVKDLLGEAALARIMPHAEKVFAGEVVHYENTLQRRDGAERHLETTYVPHRGADGAVIGIFVFAFDVSERWEAEAKLRDSELRFRQLAENIQEVFWMSSATGDELLYVSPGYERIWQRSMNSLFENRMGWLEAIHADDQPRVRALFNPENLVQGRFDVEYRVVRPDGSVRWIRDRGFPVHDQTGQVRRIAGLAADITEIKQAAERERELLADLAHMARLTAVGEMASGLAHELNQPLAAIINYIDASLEMLRDCISAADVRPAMDAAAAEAERAGQIVHRMKNFLRRTEPHRTAVDVNTLVQEALALAERDIRLSGARLSLHLADSLPSVTADRIQIEQVILNLVRNALDAMQDNSPAQRLLTVRTGCSSEAAVHVAVIDTGCGLPPAASAQLFQPFYTTKPDGMGMGLAISRRIIMAHGGQLEAASGLKCGASFTFTLPVDAKGLSP